MQRYAGTLFVLATIAGTAIAAVTSPSIVPPVKSAIAVDKLGYEAPTEVSYDDGAWEADAFHDNRWREVHLDATGKIVSDELND